jgi:hypothetical protein
MLRLEEIAKQQTNQKQVPGRELLFKPDEGTRGSNWAAVMCKVSRLPLCPELLVTGA